MSHHFCGDRPKRLLYHLIRNRFSLLTVILSVFKLTIISSDRH
ncbi:hypothetical protein [Laspinema sp. D2d]|nr:hypothetical protein [Laspinema sp. D2d]